VLWCVITKGKGGFVAKSLRADLEVLDDRFLSCKPYAERVWFKNGRDQKFELKIENLDLEAGAQLDVELQWVSVHCNVR
jgi:hypothetical protein